MATGGKSRSEEFNIFFMWHFDPIPRHVLPLLVFAVTLIGHTSPSQRPLLDNMQQSQETDSHSNPKSQQLSGRRPTPFTARPLESASVHNKNTNDIIRHVFSRSWSQVTFSSNVSDLFWRCPLRISGHAAAIVWGNSLQAGRSRVRFPILSL